MVWECQVMGEEGQGGGVALCGRRRGALCGGREGAGREKGESRV